MRIVLVLFVFFFVANLQAQFGVNFRYNQNNYSGLNSWIGVSENTSLLDQSFEIGIDYWKRLKNYRVEFFPEIAFSTAETSLSIDEIDILQDRSLHLYANTRFYILDFMGDCDCPTFSKEGNWFSKGFYLLASPGMSWSSFDAGIDNLNYRSFGWNLGAGAGLDIGIQDLVTISPQFNYRIHSNREWDALGNFLNEPDPSFTKRQWQFSIRVGLRLDYSENNRFRR